MDGIGADTEVGGAAPKGEAFALSSLGSSGTGVYALTWPGSPPLENELASLKAQWDRAWSRAGVETAPPLLVLADGMELTPLGPAELREVGWALINLRDLGPESPPED